MAEHVDSKESGLSSYLWDFPLGPGPASGEEFRHDDDGFQDDAAPFVLG